MICLTSFLYMHKGYTIINIKIYTKKITLVGLKLIILFVEMLTFSKEIFSQIVKLCE